MPSRQELEYPFLTHQTKELRQGPAYLTGIAYFPGKSMAPNFLPEAYVDEVPAAVLAMHVKQQLR